MALRGTDGDENSQRPISNRPPDAIRPHMRFVANREGGLKGLQARLPATRKAKVPPASFSSPFAVVGLKSAAG